MTSPEFLAQKSRQNQSIIEFDKSIHDDTDSDTSNENEPEPTVVSNRRSNAMMNIVKRNSELNTANTTIYHQIVETMKSQQNSIELLKDSIITESTIIKIVDCLKKPEEPDKFEVSELSNYIEGLEKRIGSLETSFGDLFNKVVDLLNEINGQVSQIIDLHSQQNEDIIKRLDVITTKDSDIIKPVARAPFKPIPSKVVTKKKILRRSII